MKKAKRIVLGTLCLIFAVAFVIRYTQLNRKYANPVINEAYIGETMKIANYSLSLDQIEWKDGSIIKELMPTYTLIYDVDGSEYS